VEVEGEDRGGGLGEGVMQQATMYAICYIYLHQLGLLIHGTRYMFPATLEPAAQYYHPTHSTATCDLMPLAVAQVVLQLHTVHCQCTNKQELLLPSNFPTDFFPIFCAPVC